MTTDPHAPDPRDARLLDLIADQPIKDLAAKMNMPLPDFVEYASAPRVLALFDKVEAIANRANQAAIHPARRDAIKELHEIVTPLPPGETTRRASNDLLKTNLTPPPPPRNPQTPPPHPHHPPHLRNTPRPMEQRALPR